MDIILLARKLTKQKIKCLFGFHKTEKTHRVRLYINSKYYEIIITMKCKYCEYSEEKFIKKKNKNILIIMFKRIIKNIKSRSFIFKKYIMYPTLFTGIIVLTV